MRRIILVLGLLVLVSTTAGARPEYRKALGLSACTDCHIDSKFSTPNPSNDMWATAKQMVANLKAQTGDFAGKTSCNDCHQGHSTPPSGGDKATPKPPTPPTPPPTPEPPPVPTPEGQVTPTPSQTPSTPGGLQPTPHSDEAQPNEHRSEEMKATPAPGEAKAKATHSKKHKQAAVKEKKESTTEEATAKPKAKHKKKHQKTTEQEERIEK